ncbi:MAG: hypothetical protein ACYCVW_08735 [Rhodocyclaceae bacterium]|jgi:hypothetical protein
MYNVGVLAIMTWPFCRGKSKASILPSLCLHSRLQPVSGEIGIFGITQHAQGRRWPTPNKIMAMQLC